MAKRNPEEMTFLDHLEELRWRIIKSVIAIGVCSIPCGIFWKQIFDFLVVFPLRFVDPRPRLIFTEPAEAVMMSLKIAAFGGLVTASPIVIYQLWKFVSPGLYKHEKSLVLPVVFSSTICFFGGVTFCYYTLPYLVGFLSTYGAGRMEAMFKVQSFMTFVILLMLAFGVVFEMPVVSFILSRAGVITPGFLIKQIRYAIVIIFIVAAVLTPPDVISQIIMALPLLVLYGISILVSAMAVRKKHV
jgi:sec-independent protein translocase protein TatC